MPVIINEIEVLDQPTGRPEPPASPQQQPQPSALREDAVLRMIRDMQGRAQRRVAD